MLQQVGHDLADPSDLSALVRLAALEMDDTRREQRDLAEGRNGCGTARAIQLPGDGARERHALGPCRLHAGSDRILEEELARGVGATKNNCRVFHVKVVYGRPAYLTIGISLDRPTVVAVVRCADTCRRPSCPSNA